MAIVEIEAGLVFVAFCFRVDIGCISHIHWLGNIGSVSRRGMSIGGEWSFGMGVSLLSIRLFDRSTVYVFSSEIYDILSINQ